MARGMGNKNSNSIILISLLTLLFIISFSYSSLAADDFILSSNNQEINMCQCSTYLNQINLKNIGHLGHTYALNLGNKASKFSSLTSSNIKIDSGKQHTLYTAINAPCDEQGSFPLDLFVSDELGLTKKITQNVNINRCSNFEVIPVNSDQTGDSCDSLVYSYKIKNIGSFLEEFEIDFKPEREIKKYLTANTDSFVLLPNTEQMLYIYFTPPCDYHGSTKNKLVINTKNTELKATTYFNVNVVPSLNFSIDINKKYEFCEQKEYIESFHIENNYNNPQTLVLSVQDKASKYLDLPIKTITLGPKTGYDLNFTSFPPKGSNDIYPAIFVLKQKGSSLDKKYYSNITISDCGDPDETTDTDDVDSTSNTDSTVNTDSTTNTTDQDEILDIETLLQMIEECNNKSTESCYEIIPLENELLITENITQLEIELKNKGVLKATYDLAIEDSEQIFSLGSDKVILPPGEKIAIKINVNLPENTTKNKFEALLLANTGNFTYSSTLIIKKQTALSKIFNLKYIIFAMCIILIIAALVILVIYLSSEKLKGKSQTKTKKKTTTEKEIEKDTTKEKLKNISKGKTKSKSLILLKIEQFIKNVKKLFINLKNKLFKRSKSKSKEPFKLLLSSGIKFKDSHLEKGYELDFQQTKQKQKIQKTAKTQVGKQQSKQKKQELKLKQTLQQTQKPSSSPLLSFFKALLWIVLILIIISALGFSFYFAQPHFEEGLSKFNINITGIQPLTMPSMESITSIPFVSNIFNFTQEQEQSTTEINQTAQGPQFMNYNYTLAPDTEQETDNLFTLQQIKQTIFSYGSSYSYYLYYFLLGLIILFVLIFIINMFTKKPGQQKVKKSKKSKTKSLSTKASKKVKQKTNKKLKKNKSKKGIKQKAKLKSLMKMPENLWKNISWGLLIILILIVIIFFIDYIKEYLYYIAVGIIILIILIVIDKSRSKNNNNIK